MLNASSTVRCRAARFSSGKSADANSSSICLIWLTSSQRVCPEIARLDAGFRCSVLGGTVWEVIVLTLFEASL
jgi:hypothetical protein